jgi:hypothetical protein
VQQLALPLLLLLLQVRMQGFSAKELSTLAVSLARLEYRPPEAWLDCFAAAAAEQMGNFGAQVRPASGFTHGAGCYICWEFAPYFAYV